MPVPPEPVLRAAARWLEHLPPSSVARCRALFTSHREFSDITPTQYEAAYAWLADTGLLEDPNSPHPAAQRLFAAAITHAEPHWISDLDDLVRSPDELPDDATRAAAALGLAPATAYAYLVTAWGKFDMAERARIGATGESALVELLRDCVNADIDHAAAVADGYGYDIAVSAAGYISHLEVKTTTRRSRLKIYLSRHEYETMRRDPSWQLVAVRLRPDNEIAAIATVNREWVASQAPIDQGGLGRWESCRFDVPPQALLPGIPALRPVFNSRIPPILQSDVQWPGAAQ
jgi:hypothetical protein